MPYLTMRKIKSYNFGQRMLRPQQTKTDCWVSEAANDCLSNQWRLWQRYRNTHSVSQ